MSDIHFSNPEHDAKHCHVTRFTVYGDPKTSLEFSEPDDLGVMTWGELKHLVDDQGGTWPTYDLFDVPQSDGTTLRYRAVDA